MLYSIYICHSCLIFLLLLLFYNLWHSLFCLCNRITIFCAWESVNILLFIFLSYLKMWAYYPLWWNIMQNIIKSEVSWDEFCFAALCAGCLTFDLAKIVQFQTLVSMGDFLGLLTKTVHTHTWLLHLWVRTQYNITHTSKDLILIVPASGQLFGGR
jgi:hypothetical protein